MKCGPESVLRLMPRAAAEVPKLKVAIVLDGAWRVWSRRAVELLVEQGDVEITRVDMGDAPPRDWQRRLLIRTGAGAQLAVASAPNSLGNEDAPADVTVYLGIRPAPASFDGCHFRFSQNLGIPYFHEVRIQAHAAPLELVDSKTGRQHAEANIAVWQGVQLGVTLASALRQAPLLLIRAMAEKRAGRSRNVPIQAAATAQAPSLLSVATFAAQAVLRSRQKRRIAANRDLGWYVALQAPGATTFTPFPSPALAADPWLVDTPDGRLFLFYEEMADVLSNGRLACVEILGPGQYGEPRVILEEPHHLSYPVVIQDEGEWFMIPESSGAATVDLYIADEFPWRWRKLRTLVSGVNLVDTTPLRREEVDGKPGWYFFTSSMVGESGCDAYLFTADTLDGDWKWHPANPICSDIRRARMAGPFWRDPASGKLYRPTQDCGLRYGYAITWNEVLRLDPEGYEEREAGRIEPAWTPDRMGTHTICRTASGWEARDGIVWVPKQVPPPARKIV